MTVTTAPTLFDLSLCIPDLKLKKKDSVLQEMASLAHQHGAVREPTLLCELLRLRERVGTTAIGKGVAVPHARSLTVTRPQFVLARSRRGVDWGAPDELPVSLVLMALAPAEWSDETYHGFVARAVGASRLQRNRQRLMAAESPADLASLLVEVCA